MTHLTRAFWHGWVDRSAYGVLRREQLYRRPRYGLRWAWRLGWELANLCTHTPLRTERRP